MKLDVTHFDFDDIKNIIEKVSKKEEMLFHKKWDSDDEWWVTNGLLQQLKEAEDLDDFHYAIYSLMSSLIKGGE